MWKLEGCALFTYSKSKGKGKAAPLHAWSGPEFSRKISSPDSLKTAQDGGRVVSFMYRLPLSPQDILPVLISVEDRGGTVVKVLCYKSEVRWFVPIWCHWIFH